MPTYLYKCDQCGHVRSVRHSIVETPEVHCLDCEELMRKKITAPRTLFKGEWETRDIMGTH